MFKYPAFNAAALIMLSAAIIRAIPSETFDSYVHSNMAVPFACGLSLVCMGFGYLLSLIYED